MTETIRPKGIEVSNSEQTLQISWNNDETTIYPLWGLRRNCPCVMCRGGHAKMDDFEPEAFELKDPPRIEIKEIRPVGNHAIQIVWSDGHDTGMYRWETLREFQKYLH